MKNITINIWFSSSYIKKISLFYMISLLSGILLVTGCNVSEEKTNDQTKTLRELADIKNKNIGAALSFNFLDQNSSDYEELYCTTSAAEFNVVVAENEMKWSSTELSGQNQFFYDYADIIVNFAEENNMKIRGHNLLWHYEVPAWVVTAAGNNRNDLQPILENHIQNLMTKYKGRIYAWDVVNEVVKDDGSGLRSIADGSSIWAADSADDSLIIAAFNKAHEADPDALLFINDYSNEEYGKAKSDKLYQMVSTWLLAGVPIHGVGFQLHLEEEWPPDMQKIRQNIDRYQALGMIIHFTEVDVRIKEPVTQAKLDHQAEIYADLIQILLDYPSVTTFLTWGVSDKHSWIPVVFPGYNSSLMFDSLYQPKPAYNSVKNLLN